jgi:hypothetical protein
VVVNQSHRSVAPKKVIILDRGEDLAAPLVHELTYQCAVYDMLQARLDGDTIKHECVSMIATTSIVCRWTSLGSLGMCFVVFNPFYI